MLKASVPSLLESVEDEYQFEQREYLISIEKEAIPSSSKPPPPKPSYKRPAPSAPRNEKEDYVVPRSKEEQRDVDVFAMLQPKRVPSNPLSAPLDDLLSLLKSPGCHSEAREDISDVSMYSCVPDACSCSGGLLGCVSRSVSDGRGKDISPSSLSMNDVSPSSPPVNHSSPSTPSMNNIPPQSCNPHSLNTESPPSDPQSLILTLPPYEAIQSRTPSFYSLTPPGPAPPPPPPPPSPPTSNPSASSPTP